MIVFFGVELGEPAGFGESATAWLRYGGYGLLGTWSDVTWLIDELNVCFLCLAWRDCGKYLVLRLWVIGSVRLD